MITHDTMRIVLGLLKGGFMGALVGWVVSLGGIPTGTPWLVLHGLVGGAAGFLFGKPRQRNHAETRWALLPRVLFGGVVGVGFGIVLRWAFAGVHPVIAAVPGGVLGALFEKDAVEADEFRLRALVPLALLLVALPVAGLLLHHSAKHAPSPPSIASPVRTPPPHTRPSETWSPHAPPSALPVAIRPPLHLPPALPLSAHTPSLDSASRSRRAPPSRACSNIEQFHAAVVDDDRLSRRQIRRCARDLMKHEQGTARHCLASEKIRPLLEAGATRADVERSLGTLVNCARDKEPR